LRPEGSRRLLGSGKAREVPEAIRKANRSAKRSLIRVRCAKAAPLHHDVNGRHGAGRVILRAGARRYGIIAGGPMRAVSRRSACMTSSQSQGDLNPYNIVERRVDALKAETSPRSVAARRSVKVSVLQARRPGGDSEPPPKAEEDD